MAIKLRAGSKFQLKPGAIPEVNEANMAWLYNRVIDLEEDLARLRFSIAEAGRKCLKELDKYEQ